MLTFAAGCVDIVGYLSAYHTFTAHMTGNTVHLGNSLVGNDTREVGLAGLVLIAFVGGSLAGRALIEVGARRRIRAIASWTLGIEAALLAIVGSRALGGLRPPGAGMYHPKTELALLAIAMGLQTATITRVGALTVHTTFVTGMINKFSQLVSKAICDSYDLRTTNADSSGELRQHRRDTVRKASFIFSIWLAYATGAAVGTGLASKWEIRTLFVPVALLCVGIIADQVLPLSVEEEKDQFER